VLVTLSETAVEIALSQIGVREQGANNEGPQVDVYLASVGLAPGYPWCAAFAVWTFRQAAQQLGIVSPCPKTAKAVKLWQYADGACRDSNPSVGALYVLDHGTPGDVASEWKAGRYTDDGHTGIIVFVNDTSDVATFTVPDTVATLMGLPAGSTSVSVPAGNIVEVSGNTNRSGSREGDSVWLHVGPSPEEIHGGMLLGYLQLDRAVQAVS
jgi:CHAP domain